ncbi:DUF6519 domain-containing protein [Paraburkholderia youngii]|uniref:DUF6519 domain-containing protein n=1 Tax=Paraburkholderia youngii TaxID=2782701 RepID=UPI003D230284
MAGDYTRCTFDPIRGYSGVHKQQGRVSLDAEHNEHDEILDRRNRAHAYDVFGAAVVPQTAPGFKIGVTGSELGIGIGRAYVDGILAECFGDVSDPTLCKADNVLGFITGNGALRYTQQPFFYDPVYPAPGTAAGKFDLAYLDVWPREVTVFEEDRLREPALNGPDTATRMQTAWQVKVLAGVNQDACANPPPSWTTLTAASSARLTAALTPSAPSPGPCVINPAGGYTGVENRLYRVEVHRAGVLSGAGGAQATFKWSRDNASLAARVLSIRNAAVAGQSIIGLTTLGRDKWMIFKAGDHIELLDDDIEFAMRETGVGGRLAHIVSVNEGVNEIQVDIDLSAYVLHSDRHTRVRRWDYAANNEDLERPATSGASVALEHGIVVTFGASGTDTLHAGDYWVFAARTADGTIDPLENAPPRGPLHHFARLAVIGEGAPPTIITDCRIQWPPPQQQPGGGNETGCCTRVVAPGESIQDAIDALKEGGCICLKTGVHKPPKPLVIPYSNVHLHGESEGAEIRVDPFNYVLAIGGAGGAVIEDVTVESIRIVVNGGAAGGNAAIVAIVSANRVTLAGMELFVGDGVAGAPPNQYVAVSIDSAADIVVRDCVAYNVRCAVAVQEHSGRVIVRDNDFTGLVPPDAPDLMLAPVGVLFAAVRGDPIWVHGNVIRQFEAGVAVAPHTKGARVSCNRILRGTVRAAGGPPVTTDALRSYLDSCIYGIELQGGLCVAEDNDIDMPSAGLGGIRVTTPDARVARNTLVGSAPTQALMVPASIYCTVDAATGGNASGATVRDNLLEQPQTGIVVSRVTGVLVEGTRFNGLGQSWYGVRFDDALFCGAERNDLAAVGDGFMLTGGDHNVVASNRVVGALAGVLALGGGLLDVRDNELTFTLMGGIVGATDTGDILLSRNRIANAGSLPFSKEIQGAVFASSNEVPRPSASTLRIDSCEITDPGIAPDGAPAKGAVRGIHAWAPNCQILSNRVDFGTAHPLDPSQEHRALLLLGPRSDEGEQRRPIIYGAALVNDNVFRGPGRSYQVELRRTNITDTVGWWFFKCVFDGNVCEHHLTEKALATALLESLHVIASSNHVSSWVLNVPSIAGNSVRHACVISNITTGQLAIPNAIPTVAGFNIQLP